MIVTNHLCPNPDAGSSNLLVKLAPAQQRQTMKMMNRFEPYSRQPKFVLCLENISRLLSGLRDMEVQQIYYKYRSNIQGHIKFAKGSCRARFEVSCDTKPPPSPVTALKARVLFITKVSYWIARNVYISDLNYVTHPLSHIWRAKLRGSIRITNILKLILSGNIISLWSLLKSTLWYQIWYVYVYKI